MNPSSRGIRRGEAVVDVRTVPPTERHPLLFRTFEHLDCGEGFVLVNDDDPLPLFYRFQTEYPDAFSWEYQQHGPEVWAVRVVREA